LLNPKPTTKQRATSETAPIVDIDIPCSNYNVKTTLIDLSTFTSQGLKAKNIGKEEKVLSSKLCIAPCKLV
jgi:hypothetical protein